MPERSISRRTFLAQGSTGAVALGAGALAARGAAGANERLSIGIIGTGGRGSGLMGQIHGLAGSHNVAITAGITPSTACPRRPQGSALTPYAACR